MSCSCPERGSSSSCPRRTICTGKHNVNYSSRRFCFGFDLLSRGQMMAPCVQTHAINGNANRPCERGRISRNEYSLSGKCVYVFPHPCIGRVNIYWRVHLRHRTLAFEPSNAAPGCKRSSESLLAVVNGGSTACTRTHLSRWRRRLSPCVLTTIFCAVIKADMAYVRTRI